jgi:hypothetical protein
MAGRTIKQPIFGRPLDAHKGGEGSFAKPGELIEIVELQPLTLNDRRVWNLLMVNAWPTITQAKQYTISKSILRGSHDSTDRLSDSIKRLMATIVQVSIVHEGKVSKLRVQLLGPTIENKDDDGLLYYEFLPQLRGIIAQSDHWARLQAQVMLSFSSKYSLTLYELIQRRANLKHVTFEDFPLDTLRNLLGVPPGKLNRFQDFRRYVLEPAVAEVSALSDCFVKVAPLKTGRTVTGYRVHWVKKDEAGLKAAYAELQRHKAGRKARITGLAETIADPTTKLDDL